jgi:peptide/nickel transport system substrate-binding protein
LVLLALGCERAPRPREIVVAVPSGPLSLTPNTVNEELTLSVQSNIYETLVDLDPELGLRPGLAESWVTYDELTWIFRLRDGVRLHDGRRLGAAQVAESLDHARLDPASRRRLQLDPVSQVFARDARTLVVRTRRPFDMLPSRLANVFVWAAGADGAPVGTGPYRVTGWVPGGSVRLAAFEQHRHSPLPIATAEFRVLDAARQARELAAGRIHLLVDVRDEDQALLRARPDVKVLTRAGLRIVFLAFDCAREITPYVALSDQAAPHDAWPRGGARNPFRDVRVRRAVALAVDRQALVSEALGGQAEVVDQIAAPLEWGGARAAPGPAPDRDEARRLLAAAGFSRGFRVGVDFMPRKYRAMERVVARLQADLRTVGVTLVPRPSEPAVMLRRVEGRDVSAYVLGWISDLGDAVLSYEYLLHTPRDGFGVTNGGGYADARLDALVLSAGGRLTPRQRRERLAEAARLVREQVPLLPLYRQVDVYAAAAWLEFTPRLDRRVRLAALRVRP